MRFAAPLAVALLALTGTAYAAPGDPWVAYVANSTASRAVLMRIDPATGGLVEVSRNGQQGDLFNHPYDVVVAHDGSLLVADMGAYATSAQHAADGTIIRVDPATGMQSLVSKGGRLVDPAGLALAADGSLLVVENVGAGGDPEIVRIDPSTGAQSVVSSGDLLCYPFGIAVERAGTVLVTDFGDVGGAEPVDCPQSFGQVVRVNPASGDQTLLAAASGGLLRNPFGIAVRSDGGIFVVNQTGGAAAVMTVDPSTGAQEAVSPNGAGDVFATPQRISFTPDGDPIVSDFELSDDEGGLVRVQLPSGAQSIVRQGGLFNNPLGVAVVANRPPAAALAAAPALVPGGGQVSFDASRSNDPEGLVLRYEWDLDGNGMFEASSGTVATAARAYAGSATLTARVRVRDPHGATSTAGAAVTVDAIRPAISRLKLARVRRRRAVFTYTLSEPAAVTIVVQRRVRRRWRRATTVSRLAPAGTGQLVTRRLRPGRYRALAAALDAAGNLSPQQRIAFRIRRRR